MTPPRGGPESRGEPPDGRRVERHEPPDRHHEPGGPEPGHDRPPRPPRSLRGRLVAGAAVLMIGAVAVTGLVNAVVLRRFMQGQIDSRLDTQINTVAAALGTDPGGNLVLKHDVEGPPFDRPGSGWYWQVVSGSEIVARSRSLAPDAVALPPPDPRDASTPPPPPGRPGHPRPAEETGPNGTPLRIRFSDMRIGGAVATILAAAPLRALTDPLQEVLISLTGALVPLGALLLGAAVVQVRLGLHPLKRLEQNLAAVRAGRLERIPGAQPAEIRPLVTELNSLLDQNAENLVRARRHVANLAHGLKTPLATLAVRLEAPGRDPDGQFQQLIGLMDRRIRHHLGRARAAALGGPARARTALGPRVEDLAAALPKIYADRGTTCAVSVPEALQLGCDAQDLDEMLGNLMDNAFKWARSRVRVAAAPAGKTVVLAVEDDGPGLPSEQMPDALRPGRRLDETSPGHGFGLPITRELAELYGGSLSLGRSAMGGLRAELTLPLAEAG